MPGSPDFSAIATLMGDRARGAMLLSLMGGRSLTATELARAAAVTKQTASSHLAKLVEARLVVLDRVGRHHYYRLADRDVAHVIEALGSLAARVGAARVTTGPADAAMRKARACYDHLAGELGVLLFDSMTERRLLRGTGKTLTLTPDGERAVESLGIDLATVRASRRPTCLACLDWSVRRHHLAGALGARVLEHCLDRQWARRQRGTRAIIFSAQGELAFRRAFPVTTTATRASNADA
ncbi:MAG: helix-turn-helix domain-containing protein [Gemmatimonadaceae bacterium]|jgi:DNA-binding transcriptional ArsR family regulator|nr:helix-turn-helix domain-containing protein [Gemmatimonadaceae bacterium]